MNLQTLSFRTPETWTGYMTLGVRIAALASCWVCEKPLVAMVGDDPAVWRTSFRMIRDHHRMLVNVCEPCWNEHRPFLQLIDYAYAN